MNPSLASSLAINGGPKVRTQGLPPRRLFGLEDKQAVTDLFDAAIEQGPQLLGYNGPQEEAYCREFSDSLGGGFADGVNSGTNAVYVALRAMEPEPFCEIIVPAVSDPGGVMPVALCNCIPVPADCRKGSYNIGAEQIAARLTARTRGVIVAHIAGLPADMDAILDLAKARGLWVMEDCAQAHGALYKGRPVGWMGDVAAFSLMSGKHHASGGQGGMVFTRSQDVYWRMRRYADRGKPFGLESADGNVVASLNCNMDELHAAIGRAQLRKLPQTVRRRREIAGQLAERCRRSLATVRMMEEDAGCQGSFWFLLFCLDLAELSVDKTTFVKAVAAEGIPVGATYLIVPTRMAWHRPSGVFPKSGLPWCGPPPGTGGPQDWPLPNIEATDAHHFRLLFHEDWTHREVDDTIAAMAKVEAAYRQ